MTKETLTFEYMKVNDLVPYAKNARTHSKEQVEKIARSIKEFGFNNPVIVDKKKGIVAGHGRVMAAKHLKMEQVPVVQAAHLTEAQKRAYILADNRLAELAEWDNEVLAIELNELVIDLETIGFDGWKVGGHVKGLTDDDDCPEVSEEEPVSKLGDIWMLGDHRLMCGDSTDADSVALLMGDNSPHLMVTDPPYGVNYDANWRNEADRKDGRPSADRATGKVNNDDQIDWSLAWDNFKGDVAYVWHADRHASDVDMSLRKSGFKIRSQIIGAKNNIVISRGDYHWKHEPCWYAVREGKTGHWNGDRKQSTLWEIDKPLKSETGHSTQKPIECMERPILNNSEKEDFVFDPFGGSGSTLIACEKTERKCLMMEIDPHYVDVIVKRWQEYTGKKAIHAVTKEYFNGQS